MFFMHFVTVVKLCHEKSDFSRATWGTQFHEKYEYIHMHTFERGEYNFITVWKNEKFILTGKKFREINPLVIF